jgi:molybdopterin synthase catalytic subunit
MANSVSDILLTKRPLERQSREVDPSAGAIVDFWGVVRDLEDGREIEGIDYEAHQMMAEHQLRLIADAAVERFRLKGVLLHHRTGFVRAGEASLVVQVTASHRAAAFEASKWIVDELKKRVPIWKKPKFKTVNQRRSSHPPSGDVGVASSEAARAI